VENLERGVQTALSQHLMAAEAHQEARGAQRAIDRCGVRAYISRYDTVAAGDAGAGLGACAARSQGCRAE
jgi:hypothetical protein